MTVDVADVVEVLLAADEPSVVLATRRNVLGEPASRLRDLEAGVRNSTRARALIAAVYPGNVYTKWQGAHWVLADLADLGYPGEANELTGLRDRVADQWLIPVTTSSTNLGRSRMCTAVRGFRSWRAGTGAVGPSRGTRCGRWSASDWPTSGPTNW